RGSGDHRHRPARASERNRGKHAAFGGQGIHDPGQIPIESAQHCFRYSPKCACRTARPFHTQTGPFSQLVRSSLLAVTIGAVTVGSAACVGCDGPAPPATASGRPGPFPDRRRPRLLHDQVVFAGLSGGHPARLSAPSAHDPFARRAAGAAP
ncbi:hypothetical protein OY671_010910, partial [Metschnikowia pulcherrima]